MLDFLRAEARRRFAVLVAEKAVMAGVKPRRIIVKDTSSRWGSARRTARWRSVGVW